MKRKSLEEWRLLIAQQQISEGFVTDFCKENYISTASFYKYKAKLQTKASSSVFVKAGAIQSRVKEYPVIALTFGNAQLRFSTECDVNYLAQLLKALQV